LATAAASTNANIAAAAGTLTSATDNGQNFDTEVLGALVGHNTRITTLESTVVAGGAAATAAVAAEAALRIAGDAATLTSANSFTTAAVAVETTARTAAVSTLTTRIAAEETARAAADTALSTRITNLDTRVTNLDAELRDKIASSAATAIAMGGSTILPDTNFTLSGNVGMYEGASAVALNAAGRVSEKVYVTAAVGGGLNKGGKLGGRVGVVFGF
jgi:hypothetical protein